MPGDAPHRDRLLPEHRLLGAAAHPAGHRAPGPLRPLAAAAGHLLRAARGRAVPERAERVGGGGLRLRQPGAQPRGAARPALSPPHRRRRALRAECAPLPLQVL